MHVTLFASVSLNGLIARPDGRADFFTDVCWQGPVEMIRDHGAVIWGRTTHDLVRGWENFRRDLVGTPVRGVVLTRHAAYAVEPSWRTASSPRAALDLLASEGRDAVVAGGGTVYSAFLREGLVDRLTLFFESVIVGEGMPFLEALPRDIPCRFLSMERLTGTVVRLDYAIDRAAAAGPS